MVRQQIRTELIQNHYTISNNSKRKVEVPECIAHEYETIMYDIMERRGHDFNHFMYRVRQRFNNPYNYFKVHDVPRSLFCILTNSC